PRSPPGRPPAPRTAPPPDGKSRSCCSGGLGAWSPPVSEHSRPRDLTPPGGCGRSGPAVVGSLCGDVVGEVALRRHVLVLAGQAQVGAVSPQAPAAVVEGRADARGPAGHDAARV